MNDEPSGYSSMLASLLTTGPVAADSAFVPELTRAWPMNDLVAFRAELVEWLSDSWDTSITVRAWWERLADAGLTMPTWPRSLGGIGAPTSIQQLIERLFASSKVIGPPVGGVGLRQVGPALRQHATPDQCERLLKPMMRGHEAWCVLMNEPDVELSEVRAAAVVESASAYLVSGDKTWSAETVGARWALVLARTDPDAPAKRRLTCFAVDLDQPGVTTIDDTADKTKDPAEAASGVKVVHLDAVTARRDNAIGGIGAGWTVAQTVVAHAQASLAGRIRRGLVDVAPGVAAGNLDRTVAEVIAEHRPRPRRKKPRDEPGSDRRHSPDLT
jgi:3-oxochol-4-en-24-oyl-CoA dehydrogenase